VLFDLGNGDLFVVREAGNVATPAGLGSIEYAVEHLKSKLVVVMGHKRCGAVEAAFCPAPKPYNYIGTLWSLILPAVPRPWRRTECDHPVIDPTQWDTAVRNNVDNMATIVTRDLNREPKWHGATVVRAFYDLENGTVSFPPGAPKK
jgi:carbonic anhydrase